MTDSVPAWLQTMRDITGTIEFPGDADNPVILGWRDEIARCFPDMADYCKNYTHDSVAWCGLTVAYCMAVNGIRPVFNPTDTGKFLWAASWAKFGKKLADPVLGCVMVFTRDGGGHVSLYEGTDGDYYLIRGGNQSDAVNVTKMHKSKFTAAVWPDAVAVDAHVEAQPAQSAVTFHSIVGGFYSEPTNSADPVSIRFNNPGALNIADWIRAYPGYVGDKLTSMSGASANSSVIFETPENGVAAWWTLLKKYRAAGVVTVGAIINRYGGGQDYSAYVGTVVKNSGLSSSFEIKLEDDQALLRFAKAMFQYEAGKPSPLSDAQILYGFALGRGDGKIAAPVKLPVVSKADAGKAVVVAATTGGLMTGVHQGWEWWQWGLLVLVVVVVVAAVVIGIRWWRKRQIAEPARHDLPPAVPVVEPPIAETVGLQAVKDAVAAPSAVGTRIILAPKAKAPRKRAAKPKTKAKAKRKTSKRKAA